MSTVLPRRFALIRQVDHASGSGVGVVALGIEFSDGNVVLRWCTAHPATSSWGSLEDMLAVHARGEKTSIQWIDPPSTELEDPSTYTGRGRRARRDAPLSPGVSPQPTAAVTVADSPPNGFPRSSGDPDSPPPWQPGRHRRAPV